MKNDTQLRLLMVSCFRSAALRLSFTYKEPLLSKKDYRKTADENDELLGPFIQSYNTLYQLKKYRDEVMIVEQPTPVPVNHTTNVECAIERRVMLQLTSCIFVPAAIHRCLLSFYVAPAHMTESILKRIDSYLAFPIAQCLAVVLPRSICRATIIRGLCLPKERFLNVSFLSRHLSIAGNL